MTYLIAGTAAGMLLASTAMLGRVEPVRAARAVQAAAQPADRFVTVDGLRIHDLDWGAAGRQPLVLAIVDRFLADAARR